MKDRQELAQVMIAPRVPLAFTANPLDRASEKRADPAWLAAQRAAPSTRILPFRNLQPLLFGEERDASVRLGFLDAAAFDALSLPEGDEVFLGLSDGVAHFARNIGPMTEKTAAALGALGHCRDVRAASGALELADIAMLGQAKALLEWHARSRFCANCGQPSRMLDGGYRRVCDACTAEHFPRTDPVVIMLVTDGERCLLARNRRFPTSINYSTLAGFVEPGESLEEAVRREVLEEVGIRIGRVSFFAAQPWPFPHSLMIGCYAEAISHDIAIDGHEIVAARWFERREIRSMIAGSHAGEIGLPRKEAIAFHLIREWADA
jgi:NAD+ diphosphatase